MITCQIAENRAVLCHLFLFFREFRS